MGPRGRWPCPARSLSSAVDLPAISGVVRHLATGDDLAELGELFKKEKIRVRSRVKTWSVAEADLQFPAGILRIAGYRLLRHMREGMDSHDWFTGAV
jgi:hypothetical protein